MTVLAEDMSIPIFKDGFGMVTLDDCMADDLSVVNSAKVSFNARVDEMNEHCRGLIRFLMSHRHGTPFEHNSFRFVVKCPLFVAREWQRHRIGSYNEWSARYSTLKPEFYIPSLENVRSQVGKPGAYSFEPVEPNKAIWFTRELTENSETAFRMYEIAIEEGIAREQARMFLPVNIYTEYYWTVNARSMMNFLSLRNDPDAQWEIRQFAEAVEALFALTMPVTHEMFVNNGRVAP